jgi:3-phenylpropionate/trans-cinnamate dioxygenase ferredoxin subunit
VSVDPVTIKLCDVDSMATGDIRVADIDGRAIAYARIDDEWFAIDDTCSHAHVSLAEGYFEADDRTIECPRHGALFSLETGEALTFPATKPVASHGVEVRGAEVFVTIRGDEA